MELMRTRALSAVNQVCAPENRLNLYRLTTKRIPMNPSFASQHDPEWSQQEKAILVSAGIGTGAGVIQFDQPRRAQALEDVPKLSGMRQLRKPEPEGRIPVRKSVFIAAVIVRKHTEDGEFQLARKPLFPDRNSPN